VTDDNVTRIHPAPSIPNPLQVNPWSALTDEQISESIVASRARADAAEHTARSLEREQARRAAVLEARAYIEKSLDNVEELSGDLEWRNEEVIEVLNDVLALLMPGAPGE